MYIYWEMFTDMHAIRATNVDFRGLHTHEVTLVCLLKAFTDHGKESEKGGPSDILGFPVRFSTTHSIG